MNNLEEIRKQKLKHLLEQQDKVEEQNDLQLQIQKIESKVKRLFSKKALERYGNLKVAHKEKSIQLIITLNHIMQSEKIEQINDNQLKELLKHMSKNKKINIIRK